MAPTTPMKQAVASSLRKAAERALEDHPTMGIHTHMRDAARALERGNTTGAQRHLSAAIGQLTPQSLQRHGVLTDEGHTAAKRHMDTAHRHILLVKDIEDAQQANDGLRERIDARRSADAEAANQRHIARLRDRAAGELPDSRPSQPVAYDQNRQVPVSQAQQGQRPAQLASSGPGKPSGAGLSGISGQILDLVGPKGYIHGWIKVDAGQGFGAGLAPGSEEHLRAIENLGGLAASPPGDIAHSSPTMKTALHNLAVSVASRDMKSARVHLASAKWANKHEAGGLWTRDLARLESQLGKVPSGASRRSPVINSLSPRAQHPGRYVSPGGIVANPTAGALKIPQMEVAQANRTGGIDLSAQTARLAVTPAPRGRPGGPGLYDVKGLEHTPYFQQVVKALIEKRGMDPGKAYAVAWGALRRWRKGGGHVHPEVQATAAGSLAGEAAKGAMARAAHGHANSGWPAIELAIELAAGGPQWQGQSRVPPGQAGGGQFGANQGAPAAKGNIPAKKGKPVPGKPPPRPGNAAQRAALKKALLAKAAVIRGQIRALQAMLKSSHHNVKTGKQAAAAAKKAASTAAKKPATAARKPGAKKPARKMTQAQIKAKIVVLQAQLKTILAQAAKL